MRSSCVPRLLPLNSSCRGQTSGAGMPTLPLGQPAPHLSFPQGFSGNPESFMLENLNGGGSMQPLTLALSRKGALQHSLSLLFPRSLAPPLVIGERESRRRGRLAPAYPKAGEWAVIPAGGSGAVRFCGPFLENSCGFPLKPAGMTEGASPAGMTEEVSSAGMTGGGVTGGNDRGGVTGGNDRGGVTGGNDRGGVTGGNDRGGVTGGNDRGGVTCGNDRGGVTCGNDRGGVTCGNDRGGVTCGNDRGGVCHQMSEGLYE